MKRAFGIAVLFAALISISATLFAQAVGTISGTIKDGTGAVIPGATVTALNQGTGVTREALSDDSGHYALPLLPVGTYNLSTALPGFRSAQSHDINLEVQQSRVLDFVLEVAGVTTEVSVSSQMAQVEVQRSDATLGQVIHAEQVAELPLNGRNFVQLALLGPGTVAGQPGGFMSGSNSSEVSYRGSVSLSAQGMRENANDWLYDGIDNNELTSGAVSILPSIEAIREFRVMTYNYSAQYGSRGSTTVLVSSKSGTNDFHGTVFEYLRNDVLDARNFFDGPQKGKYIQNEYGFSLGGPIHKDRTFFFGDFQGNKIRQGLTILSTVPTALMRQGVFTEAFPGAPAATVYDPTTTRQDPATGQFLRDPFPGNRIPANQIEPIGQALVSYYPLPTFTDRLGGNYLSNPVKTLDDAQWDARIDHEFSAKDSIFIRFSWDNASQYLPSGLPGFGAAGAFSSNQNFTTHSRNIAISETHVLRPDTINQFTAGYNRDFNYIRSFGYLSEQSKKLGIPGANLGTPETSSLTQITVTNFNGLGDRQFSPFQGGTNVYHFADNLAIVRGKHTMNVGFTNRAMQLNLLGDNALAGSFTFDRFFTAAITSSGALDGTTGNSIASLLMGIPSAGSRNNLLNGSVRGRRWKEYRGFLDDTWAMRPNLTLNLGIAYSVTTPLSEAADRFANFDFYTGKYYKGGTVGVNTDRSNVQPRFGFAWSPFGDAATVIRGGYGIFHDVSAIGGSQGPQQNPPYSSAYAFTANNITPTRKLSTGFPDNSQPIDPSAYTGDWRAISPNFKQGIIQQWNVNAQRSLPLSMVFSVAYAGSHGTRLMDKNFNLNTATPGSGFNPSSRRAYPQYNGIFTTLSRGWLKYNSLQLRLERRAANGMYLLGAYTYSRALTNGLQQEITGDPGVKYFPLAPFPKADDGFAATDLRHSVTISYLYPLPVGKGRKFLTGAGRVANGVLGEWQINGITTMRSGFPLGFTMSSNQSGTALSNRPNMTCAGTLSAQDVNKWFDASCFSAPATGALGTAPRTPDLHGPQQVNFDASLYKTIGVTEHTNLQFRTEFFNVLNHAQFATPNTTVGNPNFGRILSTVKSPRQVQFALKYIF
jgi:hypothetical protein